MIIIYKFAHYTPLVATPLVPSCPVSSARTHDATLISVQRFFVLMHKHDATYTCTRIHMYIYARNPKREREREGEYFVYNGPG